MNFPPFPMITPDHLNQIIAQHNLAVTEVRELPQVGIFNKIYQLGEPYILRIARDHPDSFIIAQVEAMAVPLARAASVSTPELIAMDDSCAILPVPYTIYTRVQGETLGLLDLDPHTVAATWRMVGQDLARLHAGVAKDEQSLAMPVEVDDPRPWPAQLAKAGYFTAMEARWLSGWLAQLAPAATEPVTLRFTHGDIQAHNIMVSAKSRAYLALIDWGCASWRDPVFDFGGVPLRAVPHMLAGYREIMPVENDETAEARILWRYLTLVLGNLWRVSEPELAWAERPLPFLLDLMRFFMETDDRRWRTLLPAASGIMKFVGTIIVATAIARVHPLHF